ncbi:hypothetical protein FXO38_02752 [Capsicum annuum]|nr:hypothetical protein FXO38_02752 [Capsicum annuum]
MRRDMIRNKDITWKGESGLSGGQDAESETEMVRAYKKEEHICFNEDVRGLAVIGPRKVEVNQERIEKGSGGRVDSDGGLRVGSWNIGTLQGKSIELVKILRKRRINIACVQETKWVGSKARVVDGYKLWYSGSERCRNGVDILVDEELRVMGLEYLKNPVWFQAAHDVIKQYVAGRFSHLLLDISDALVKVHDNQKGVTEEEYPLQASLETNKRALIQGSMDALLDFRRVLDEDLEVLSRLTDLVIEWVQEGFQDFFRKLNDQFLVLSGKKYLVNQDLTFGEGMQGDKVLPELVLLLAQLSVFIEQNAITRITEARNWLIVTSV